VPTIAYIKVNFRPHVREMIGQANAIITELGAQGYTLTLRQLFYQFVSRDLIRNTQKEYDRLGDTVSKARRAGLIDWNAIEDRTRNLRSPSSWDSAGSIVQACADSFNVDRWASQRYRPEVWVEKDALIGVLEVACGPLFVPYFSCRGYVSDSEVWGAAMRLKSYQSRGQTPVIFHLGDHDPSGLDMTEDILKRAQLFAGGSVRVERLALNMDQVEQYQPPPNPAKQTDSRFVAYAAQHGDESWELDALNPQVIGDLIRAAVNPLIDPKAWKADEARVAEARKTLAVAAARWDDVAQWLRKKPKKPRAKRPPKPRRPRRSGP
jgi:hypothetical protein